MGQGRHRRRRTARRVVGGLAVGGTAVFGVAALSATSASATPVPPPSCPSATAVPGDTVAGLVYRWGLNWRNMTDVWHVAQANPMMPDPNVLAVGEVVTDCSSPTRFLHASVPVSAHGLAPGETLAGLESAVTGTWHWPIPVWDLAQANPDIAGPFEPLPVGTVVRLLGSPMSPPSPIPAPTLPVSPPPRTPLTGTPFVPSSEAPKLEVPSATPTSPKAPPAAPPVYHQASVPVPTPPPAPVLPPATLPPEPPKITEEAPLKPAPPAPSDKAADNIGTKATPPPPPAAPAYTTAALGMKIHGDLPVDPHVVAHDYAQLAVDDPSLTPEGDATIIGGFIQESGLNPTSTNHGEGAHGLGQWEGGRHCGDSGQTDAELACAAHELETAYPTAQAILSNPRATPQQLARAEDIYEGEGKVGRRRSYAESIIHQVIGS